MLKNGYDSKVIFHLPGAFNKNYLYEIFLDLYQNDRDVFYKNAKIGSVYGSPECIWNGGRLVIGCTPPGAQEIIDYRDFMHDKGIPVRFTFTNSLLEEHHLYNDFANFLLETFSNGENEIICNSPLLEKYIRNKCGDLYKYISSTTKCILNKTILESELDKYYLTVLDYRLNKNMEIINSINNKKKIEILCNAVCDFNCSRRKLHYDNISKEQIMGVTSKELDVECECMSRTYAFVKKESKTYISPEDINNIYSPRGYKNFKLEGRSNPVCDLVEMFVDYLIKDDLKMDIREYLFYNLFNNRM